jgi:YVTN family beta-propeller protein
MRAVVFGSLALLLLPACERAQATEHAPAVVYVSNEDDGTVTMIDSKTDAVIGTINVGKRPRGLKLSPDQRFLYVAVSGTPKGGPSVDERTLPPPDRSADGVAVIDLHTQRVVRLLESGSDPETFDLSPNGSALYVANEDAARVSVIDVVSGKVLRTIDVGREPEGVTTRPDGAFVYVSSEQDHWVDVIDAKSNTRVARIPTAARPRAILFTPNDERAFVSAEAGGSVTVIDARHHRALGELRFESGARPMGLALSKDGRTLFVTTGRHRDVLFVDVNSRRVQRRVENVGVRPWGIGITPDGRKLYVANGPSNDVAVIDVETGALIARVKAGGSPWGIAISR